MPGNPYEKIQALVIDDFENFRNTVSKMLQIFGIRNVDSAATGAEALRYCASKVYDVILCDQNLGKGKSGQQILEVLRHKPSLNSDSLFVLISAETNKSIIMAAYDYEPDAYLTKPITSQALEQRLQRLFAQRLALMPIHKAMKEEKIDEAIALCKKKIADADRFAGICQKMLGRLLLDSGRYEEAESIYRELLEVRQLDWAMLGMALAKKNQGDSLSAQHWLEEILQLNPLCLKAYDTLAEIMRERGDFQSQQKIIQQAVDVSPLSILRQQILGDISLKNNDVLTAASAYRKAVKIGENSCFDNLDTHENFARAGVQLAKIDKVAAKPILRDALKVIADIPVNFGKNNANKVNSYLLESQLHMAASDERRSLEALGHAEKIIATHPPDLPIESKIEYVKTLREVGHQLEADNIIAELLAEYAADEQQLQKIDCLLDEPRSVKNKAVVAKVNKDGIAFYDAKDFVRAVECFSNALQDFPQHIGLRLNLVQALIGLSKQQADKTQSAIHIKNTLDTVRQMITERHPQFPRFRQLDDVLNAIS